MTGNPFEIYNIAVKRVPAYRKFLLDKLGEIPKVNCHKDFQKLPFTNKKEYMKNFPIDELCLDGTLLGKHVICRSSGTTGKPFYWPKIAVEEENLPIWLGSGLQEAHNIEKYPILIIVALGLGSWISGEQSTWAMRSLALKNKNITLLTPGTQIEEIIQLLEMFSPLYPQTLLISYPPFAKTIIDKAQKAGLPIESYNIKLGLVGEAYSEHFREYIKKTLNHKDNDILSIWSGYGSADFGVIGKETALTVTIRQTLYRKGISFDITGFREIPAICQFDPNAFHLEIDNGELIITKYQGVPLVRYRTGDRVNIIDFKEMISRLKNLGENPLDYIENSGFNPSIAKKMPFILIAGRIDGSISFYGGNIEVGQVREVIENTPELSLYFTGKFQIKKTVNEKMDPIFKIFLEKKKEVSNLNNNLISGIISRSLAKISSEYSNTLTTQGEKAMPEIVIVDENYFSNDSKISYIGF